MPAPKKTEQHLEIYHLYHAMAGTGRERAKMIADEFEMSWQSVLNLVCKMERTKMAEGTQPSEAALKRAKQLMKLMLEQEREAKQLAKIRERMAAIKTADEAVNEAQAQTAETNEPTAANEPAQTDEVATEVVTAETETQQTQCEPAQKIQEKGGEVEKPKATADTSKTSIFGVIKNFFLKGYT